ncbi:MAG: hypothetical protein ABIW84_04785 [Ilumatobacteraceae bacterium]
MLKRVTWFVSGAVAGVAGAGYVKKTAIKTVKKTVARLSPRHVAASATARIHGRGRDVAEAVRDGRQAMRVRESELRERLDHAPARRRGRRTPSRRA